MQQQPGRSYIALILFSRRISTHWLTQRNFSAILNHLFHLVVQVGADYDHFNIREQNHGIVPEADEALVHQDATGIHLGRELVGDVVKLVWTGYRGYDDFA
jgi:hypothetical protein